MILFRAAPIQQNERVEQKESRSAAEAVCLFEMKVDKAKV